MAFQLTKGKDKTLPFIAGHTATLVEECPFKFRISFDVDVGRWFFPPSQGSEGIHQHHFQKISLGAIVLPTTSLDKHKMRVLMEIVAIKIYMV
jgi:hypothetical protein